VKNQKKTIFIAIYVIILIIIEFIPLFLPISIMDYSYRDWKDHDLSENITGDEFYYNNTYHYFNRPNNLTVFDLRGKNYQQQIALTTLQGLVNRDNVSIFLIYRSSDLFWLQQLNQTHGINYTILNDSQYWNLFQQFDSKIEGLIIYDHKMLDTVNVATFLSGINNSIVIHESMLAEFSSIGITNVLYDFRDQFISRYDLYFWAWDSFNHLATRKMVSSLDPYRTWFRDYVVANKIFAFYLSGGPFGQEKEIDLFKYIINEYPNNIPVFGWFTDPGGALGEYESVKILSQSGKYSLCAAIPDLTVFGAFNITLKQKEDSFNVSEFNLENKVYVAVVVSDGDNVNFCADVLQRYWQDPNRGTVPVGITLEPALFKLFPDCINYYYNNATENEYFLAGPSGAGYCYVDMNPSFPEYLNQSKFAMNQADMDQVWLLNGYEPYQIQYSKDVIEAYASDNCNLSGIYLNYHEFPAELNYVSNAVPVFQSV